MKDSIEFQFISTLLRFCQMTQEPFYVNNSLKKITPQAAENKLKESFQLLKGEEYVFYYPIKTKPKSSPQLTLYITTWAVRGAYDGFTRETESDIHNFVIPLKTIIEIEKHGGQKMGKGNYGVKFLLSTGSQITFPFPMVKDDRTNFIRKLQELRSNPFEFSNPSEWIPNPQWMLDLADQSHFTIIKNDFCETYPSYLLIDPESTEELVKECSNYRSKHRVPVLSALYNDIPLLRSSQPLTGLTNSSSQYDQQYLKTLCKNRPLTILDCRPKINAVANQFTGGGYESKNHYKKEDRTKPQFHFLDIPNIHKVRECYTDMIDKLFSHAPHPYHEWGALTMQLLKGACRTLKHLQQNQVVLVHCSDGWDRTAQISALAQILFVPKTRTIQGFVELVQHEWLDYGHMFGLRCFHTDSTHINESSPIFAQFIDAVAQLIMKYPNHFEYNIKFLEFLLANAYAQLFGDFLGTNYKKRIAMKRPTSIFSCLDDERYGIIDLITNDGYQESTDILVFDADKEKYQFIGELLGTPVFFSDTVPIVQGDPPALPTYTLDDVSSRSIGSISTHLQPLQRSQSVKIQKSNSEQLQETPLAPAKSSSRKIESITLSKAEFNSDLDDQPATFEKKDDHTSKTVKPNDDDDSDNKEEESLPTESSSNDKNEDSHNNSDNE